MSVMVTSDVGHWALVPSWVRKALRGQSKALELYVVLADIADHPDREGNDPTAVAHGKKRKWLAEEMDCSPATVDRSIDLLVEVGAVTVVRRQAADGDTLPNDYHIHQLRPEIRAALAASTDQGGLVTHDEGGAPPREAPSPSTRGGLPAHAEVIRNQPPINQPPSTNQPPPPVASDAGPVPEVEQTPRRRKAKKEPSHPNYDAAFDVIAQAFGLDPVGLPDKTRGKVLHSRACAFDAGLLDDLQHLADVVWLFRGQPAGIPDIGTFGSACHRIATDPDELRLIPHRAEAMEIVAAAIERVPELAGHCKGVTRPQAECAIATALAAGHARGVVKTAMLTASQWTKGALLGEVGRCKAARFPGRGLPEIPADLSEVDPLQLVEWLKAADGHDVSVAPRLAEALGRHLDAADLSNPDTVGDWRAVLRGDGWPRQGSVVFRLRGDLWDRLAAAADAQRKPAAVELTAGTTIRTLEGSTTR